METPRLERLRHSQRLVLERVDVRDQRQDFLQAVAQGLGHEPKSIPPKFFYDEEGSALFERITELEEYYPTRTEAQILADHGEEMLQAAGHELSVVELGSGSSTKTRLLLDILSARQSRVEYLPIDISPSVVTEFGAQLLEDYPSLHIRALICDYFDALSELKVAAGRLPRLFLFLGSSLGNFTPEHSARLLAAVRDAMAPEDRLLLGVDMKKDPTVLQRAYDDAQGVTAAFNLNLLARINRELGGHFAVERFRHLAFYNEEQGRIEMHLESGGAQLVRVDALERSYAFREGETIHTENSYKFDRAGLERLAVRAGLRLQRDWSDARGWFTLNLLAPA